MPEIKDNIDKKEKTPIREDHLMDTETGRCSVNCPHKDGGARHNIWFQKPNNYIN